MSKTRHILKLILGIALGTGAIPVIDGNTKSAYAATQQIVAVVNDDAISISDFEKRLKLIIASSGLPDNQEIRQRLGPQIVGSLVEEQLMLQEAENMKLSIEQEEVDRGFATIAQQNKMKPEQFKKMLKKGRIDITTLYRQIRAQIAWSKVVQSRLRPRVIISEQDIDAALERMRSKIGTTEYLAAEIYLPFSDENSERQSRKLASRLISEIKNGKASFFKVAQQFSKGAGAARGGDTGWLNEEQISPDMLEALKKVKKNQLTNPIRSEDGYYILFLRETRQLTEDTLPSRQQVEYNLGNERLERLQRRHLLDVKASSFIDIRV
tara:strand:- start:3875 stop:4846 length:972 start_codon:yes stop_codon:yes gene_type:complete